MNHVKEMFTLVCYGSSSVVYNLHDHHIILQQGLNNGIKCKYYSVSKITFEILKNQLSIEHLYYNF